MLQLFVVRLFNRRKIFIKFSVLYDVTLISTNISLIGNITFSRTFCFDEDCIKLINQQNKKCVLIPF